MIYYYDVTKENIKEHNPSWPKIPDHPYRKLIIRVSGSGKTNWLFSLMRQQPGIDDIYLYAKDPYEAKYQLSIRKRKDVGTKFLMILKLLVNAQIVWMIFMKT